MFLKGHTKALNFYAVGSEPKGLLLVDAPGYGARGRPEWGKLFDHYITTREQYACIHFSRRIFVFTEQFLYIRLKRVYILFNAKHGLNQSDVQMLEHLSENLMTAEGVQPFTLQSVITKVDTLPVADTRAAIEKMRIEIWKAAPLCLPPIITSAAMNPPFGLEALRANIANACGLS